MSIENVLKKVFDVILDEVKSNEDFAKRIEVAIGKEKVETKSKRRKKQPASLNPNTVIVNGEKVLRGELEKLEVVQLKDIISQYTMDPAKTTNRWRSKDRFINYIIEVSLARSKKGDAFR